MNYCIQEELVTEIQFPKKYRVTIAEWAPDKPPLSYEGVLVGNETWQDGAWKEFYSMQVDDLDLDAVTSAVSKRWKYQHEGLIDG